MICSCSHVQNDRVCEHVNMYKPQPKAESEEQGVLPRRQLPICPLEAMDDIPF